MDIYTRSRVFANVVYTFANVYIRRCRRVFQGGRAAPLRCTGTQTTYAVGHTAKHRWWEEEARETVLSSFKAAANKPVEFERKFEPSFNYTF